MQYLYQYKKIKTIAVLGSGIMGSRLACHFANAGFSVILLDIVTPNLSETELNDKNKRNLHVNQALKNAIQSNPAPLYINDFAKRITTGNFEDDMPSIAKADWILEAVIEVLPIKIQLFEQVETYRVAGTLVSSNTSGIPISLMLKGRSDDFKAHFCGTHFFNPPRYLKLLEIIPSQFTSKNVIDFFKIFGEKHLGKTTVICKDTPAFIANRIGVFRMMLIMHLQIKYNLSIDDVDLITGTIIGNPKSATYRTSDIVGLDTLIKVAQGVAQNCEKDGFEHYFEMPDFVKQMEAKGYLGDKSKQGFYKKEKQSDGTSIIKSINIKTLEYEKTEKPRYESIKNAKPIDLLKDRLKFLSTQSDVLGLFLAELNHIVFAYCSHRVGDIADHLYQIDEAMKAGFGLEIGPFENWHVLGEERILNQIEKANVKVADWIKTMIANNKRFYFTENGKSYFYNQNTQDYELIPGKNDFVILENYKNIKPIWSNKGCTLHHIGDGILNLEFHTKMNTIGSEVLDGLNKAIDLAEKQYAGLVIANEAAAFSAGANLAMVFMLAIEQEYDELDFAIRHFQNTVMRMRYSNIPVVIAPHGLTLGGGCEMTLHADAAIVAAETYMGLVEVGVGVIPGGGGTKEFVLKVSESVSEQDPYLPLLAERFTTIATAKVATSGHEAFQFGYLSKQKDRIHIHNESLISIAKAKALELYQNGYTMPMMRQDIKVLGKTALGALYAGAEAFKIGGYATDHDLKIARKLAFVMAGGNLSEATLVNEQYLLDLEREAFLSLLGEKKTLERIQSVLSTGKAVRN